MSVDLLSPPIVNLNEDILLYIFSMNADMFVNAGALDETRKTSQVCHTWRNVMLASPSLWARLLDIDCIPYICSDEWLHELIRRSGNAPLWIRASTFRPPTYISKLFNVIEENWHRIQRLVLHGAFPSINFSLVPSGPAPDLATFIMTIDQATANDENKTSQLLPLFGGYAPMLQCFDVNNYVVDQREPWLCGLQSLTLHDLYGVREALEMLLKAHNLQHLEITGLSDDIGNTTAYLPVISPSHLRALSYYGNALPCLRLLEHVKIPPDCYLSIHIPIFSDGLYSTAAEALITQFTRHTRNYLRSHTFPVILLHYVPNLFINFEGRNICSPHSQQRLELPLNRNGASEKLAMMMKELAVLDFSKTQALQLFSDGSVLDPFFGSFFSSFSSVETISIDSNSLKALMGLQNHTNTTNQPGVIFPVLRFINFVISSLDDSGSKPTEQVAVAEQFILSRVQNGHPICLLDMGETLPFDAHLNFDALTEVEDIEVIYTLSAEKGKIREYTWSSYYSELYSDDV